MKKYQFFNFVDSFPVFYDKFYENKKNDTVIDNCTSLNLETIKDVGQPFLLLIYDSKFSGYSQVECFFTLIY